MELFKSVNRTYPITGNLVQKGVNLQGMPKPSNDNLSEAMDALALKFVKEMRSAISEQITLSVQKEILLQIEKVEKVNINYRKTSSASQNASSSQAIATSSHSNDTRKNDKGNEISSSQSNEHSGTSGASGTSGTSGTSGKDNEGAKNVHGVDADESNRKDKKKKRKRKRQADDGEETMNRFSCKQQ